MRPILFAAAMIGAASVLASTDAMAQFYPRVPFFGARLYGPGFFGPRFFGPALYGPGFYGPRFYRPGSAHVGIVRKKPISTKQVSTKHLSPKQASTKHVSSKQASSKHFSTKHVSTKKVPSKQVSTRQASTRHGSTISAAPTTSVSARPGARTVIPLPERELLTPTPQFNCEFKTTSVDDASGQPQPSPTRAQADPSTDVRKLEYERECYRHAETILRDRLRQLQAAVGETIEAVNRSEQPAATTGISTGPARTAIPLPEQELLTAQPEFDCEFKTASADDASHQPRTSPTQPDPSTDGELRKKLDYERECYRHTEMIVRDRLRLLQVSVGETMKAVIWGLSRTEAPQEAQ